MTVDPRRVAAAHALLAQLGVSVEDLLAAPAEVPATPAVAQYLPRVQAAASPSSCRTYGTYWARMVEVWGDWPLDTVAATDVEALQRDCAAGALRRANGRGGRHAGENVISAARAFFTRAIADGLLAACASPAHQVSKPRRLPSHRRAPTARELLNVALFIPLGMFLRHMFRRGTLTTTIIGLGVSLLIELTQLTGIWFRVHSGVGQNGPRGTWPPPGSPGRPVRPGSGGVPSPDSPSPGAA